MEIKIPQALIREHQEINDLLEIATRESGNVGAAARSLMQVLRPHQAREEAFALPPLGLLRSLAAGELDYDMAEADLMISTLRANMPQMIADHQAIGAALENLATAAQQEGKPRYAGLAAQLRLHMEEEEEVYYPAAELVGIFLETKLGVVLKHWVP